MPTASMRKIVTIVLLNILLFFLLRYFNVVILYLTREQQVNHVVGFWDFLPSYLVQVFALMATYFRRIKNEEITYAFIYPVTIVVITILYVLCYLNIIPDISDYLDK